MRHGSECSEALMAAAAKSAKWHLVDVSWFQRGRAGRAIDCLPLIGDMLDQLPIDDREIRLSCGQVHSWIAKNLSASGVQCALAIGDVEVGAAREYGTSYQTLKKEFRGAHRDGDSPYPFHVWLTFPDMHVIDATFYIYKYYDALPQRWKWSEYIICSDHSFAQGIEIRYVPMLLRGADLVDKMIFVATPPSSMRTGSEHRDTKKSGT